MNAKLVKLHPLFLFLALELLAIVGFGLGGNNVVYYILGFIVAIFGVVLTFKRIKKNEIFSLLMIAIPILLIAVFVSFGVLSQKNGVLVNIATFIGIISFFLIGLSMRRSKGVNAELILICIGGGLALLVLISMIATWCQYGLFYGIRYKSTPIYFYGGERFDVTEEQSWLNGFSFVAVTLRYSGLFGVLLSTGLAGLFFINPKKELRKFIISGVIGFIGLLSLLTTPNVVGLLMLIPMLIVAGYTRVMMLEVIPEKVKKGIRNGVSYTFIGIVIILVILFAVMFLNANGYDQIDGYKPIASRVTSELSRTFLENDILRKIFNNESFMGPINRVLNQSAIYFNYFGFISEHTASEVAMYSNTKMFEIEIIKEGGIFAFIVLAFFLVFVVQNIFKYGKNSKDSKLSRGLIVTLLITFIIYSSFNNESFPFVHIARYYNSMFRSLPGLIFIFLIGFSFYPDLKQGEVPEFEKEIETSPVSVEVSKENEVKDDYFFDNESEEVKDEQ